MSNCGNKKSGNVKLFGLPKAGQRRDLWLKRMAIINYGNTKVENLFVCSLHFVSGIHLYIITTSDNNNIYVILFFRKAEWWIQPKTCGLGTVYQFGIKKAKTTFRYCLIVPFHSLEIFIFFVFMHHLSFHYSWWTTRWCKFGQTQGSTYDGWGECGKCYYFTSNIE